MKSIHVLQGSFFILILFIIFPTPTVNGNYTQNEHFTGLSIHHQKDKSVPSTLTFFPLGIYGVRNSLEIWDSWKQRFNTVIFGLAEPEDFDELDIEDMLLTCDYLGMRVLFETSYFLRESTLDDLTDFLPDVVNHPSIYAWFIVNEPGLGGNNSRIDQNTINTAIDIIQQADDRPTLVQYSLEFTNLSQLETDYTAVPDIVDFVSVDPYPNMPNVNHSIVTEWVNALSHYNADRAKIWTSLSAYDTSQSQGEQGYNIPNESEFMMDSVLALQQGVEGLNWFTYGLNHPFSFGVHENPSTWDALGRVVKRISQVIPVLIGRENEMQIYSVDDNIEAAYAKRGNQSAIFIANHNYVWNGTETIWTLQNHTISLGVPAVNSVSIIEPSGPKSIDFKFIDSILSFNITINGGLILLIDTPNQISLLEFHISITFVLSFLMIIVIIYRIKLHNKRFNALY